MMSQDNTNKPQDNSLNKQTDTLSATVPDSMQGMRVDKALAELFPQFSRSMLQKWLKQSLISVDDDILMQKQKVLGGEDIVVIAPQMQDYEGGYQAEAMTLNIVYEDDDVIVINKPAGLVVHPGAGNWQGTLLNGLLHHDKALANIARAGIVHRLDKLTSGLMVVAKNDVSRLSLINQLQERSVSRTYYALVCGVPVAGATVNKPIARHATDRRKMAVYHDNHTTAKEAVTHFKVKQKFRRHAWLEVKLETGRTHQIRVHMQSVNYPLIGDPQYGQRLQLHPDMSEELSETLKSFHRQALHATKLEFIHPKANEILSFEAEMPEDMLGLVGMLESDNS